MHPDPDPSGLDRDLEPPTLDRYLAIPQFENIVAVRGLLIAGCVITLLGVAFFLKLAFDNQWITAQGRVILGLVAGTALVLGAIRRTSNAFVVFAEAMIALGSAILYLSTWAATNAYHFIDREVGLIGLIAVTAMLGGLAWQRASARLAYGGLIGGLVTPLLVGELSRPHADLAVYLVILAAGSLAVATRFKYLDVAAYLGVTVYASLFTSYQVFAPSVCGTDGCAPGVPPWQPWETIAVHAVLLLEFVGAFISRAYRTRAIEKWPLVITGVQIALFAGTLQLLLPHEHREHGIDLVVLAAVLAGAALVKALPRLYRTLLACSALASVTLAILATYGWSSRADLWAVEGAVLLVVGARGAQLWPRIAGYTLLGFSALIAFLQLPLAGTMSLTPFANEYALSVAIVCLALGLAIRAVREFVAGDEHRFAGIAGVLVVTWGSLAAVAVELARFLQHVNVGDAAAGRVDFGISMLLTAYACALLLIGLRNRDAFARSQGLVLFVITIVKVFAVDLASVDVTYRIGSFIGLGVVLVAVSAIYQRAVARWKPAA